MMMNGMMMDASSMMIMCVMMFLGALIFLAAIGFTVYTVIRILMKKSRVDDYPLMILRERFAKGEITEEEFKQKQNTLG